MTKGDKTAEDLSCT